ANANAMALAINVFFILMTFYFWYPRTKIFGSNVNRLSLHGHAIVKVKELFTELIIS
ncbi:MAG: hypothetical protein ACI8Z9_000720, partial [Paraglaciecola sp.]